MTDVRKCPVPGCRFLWDNDAIPVPHHDLRHDPGPRKRRTYEEDQRLDAESRRSDR
jgi:hypothetical protein